MKKIIVLIIAFLGTISFIFSQTLDDYFKIAAENNPGLQAKYKNFEMALQKVPQVSSLPDPNLSFGYFISPVETRVGPQNAKFSLTQMFPWFGTLQAQKDAATLMAEANYKEFVDSRNRLYYQVAAAYYPLYELQQLLFIETENIGILESYKSILNVKFQNGNGAMIDVVRVDIMLNEATTELSILNQKRKPLETQFNNLLNRSELELIVLSDTLIFEKLNIGYRYDSLLISSPLLSALEMKVKSSEMNEQIAIKQGMPKIGVGLDYIIVGERTDMTLTDNGKDAIIPMLSVSLPIYRKKYQAAKYEAQLMTEFFTLQKEDIGNQLSSNYEMTWFELQQKQELIALYDVQIVESKQSLNLLYNAYSNSGKDFEEVLRMQQQLLVYQKLKITALVDYCTALAKMDYITSKNR